MGLGIKMDALSVKQNGAFVQIDKFLFQRLHPGAGQLDDGIGQCGCLPGNEIVNKIQALVKGHARFHAQTLTAQQFRAAGSFRIGVKGTHDQMADAGFQDGLGAGRGFAVVASEVRNLAVRTADSSKKVEGLIKESLERVQKGDLLVQKSGEILKGIVSNTKETSDIIVEIAAAMREQSSAIEQIQIAVNQMNEVTQQNAALGEELTASSDSMNSEAEELAEMVSRFRI